MRHLELGDGDERILWLHGGNVAGWMWGPQVPDLPEYRSLVPDFPGFGDSADEPWVSIADTADRCAELLGDRPAHVVGLSLGSSLAIELAARHPRLVTSLVLSSTQAVPPTRRDRMLVPLLLSFWNRPWFWTTTARAYGLEGEDAAQFVENGLRIERATAVAIFEEVCRGIPRETLARVQAPTVAVAGEKDSSAVTRGSLELLGRGIPGAVIAIAPGMHHQWNVEAPELFTSLVREWITGRTLAPGLRATMERQPPHPL